MILLGYTIISLSYPILLAAVTLVCNTWLGDNERTFWTQICGLSIPIGTVVSFLMTGLIYKDPNTMKEDTKRLILFQNIWASLVAIPFFLLVRDKPEIAPSSVAAQKKSRARLIPSFRKALRDKNYVYLLIIFALIDGEFISFSSVMSLLFDYYNTPT
jgi:MFS-type transporter involved in bile tolerance (Atg22 family)